MELLNFDFVTFIKTVGYVGIFAIIFSESGLFIGFFLPGDSLLFTAGFLASQGYLNIVLLVIICFAAAVLGDSFGYAFGYRIGPKIFNKENSRFFRREYIERTRAFYDLHGKKTIVLARFIPVIRTLAPIFAGVGNMRYPTFLFYNVVGAFLWTVGLLFLGFTLGNTIPNIDRYIIPIVILIAITSFIPALIHILRGK